MEKQLNEQKSQLEFISTILVDNFTTPTHTSPGTSTASYAKVASKPAFEQRTISAVRSVLQEEKSAELMKRTVIIENLPMPEGSSSQEKQAKDKDTIELLCQALDIDSGCVSHSVRMPQYNAERPPIMKLILNSPQARSDILSNKLNLKDSANFEKVFIRPSLPTGERNRGNMLRTVCKDWNSKLSDGLKFITTLNFYTEKFEIHKTMENSKVDWKTHYGPSAEDVAKAERTIASQQKSRKTTHSGNGRQGTGIQS